METLKITMIEIAEDGTETASEVGAYVVSSAAELEALLTFAAQGGVA